MLDDKDISINRSIKMWKNFPLDSRQVTESLAKLDEYIQYPYLGMIFYSKQEDDYYKVLSLEDGYKSIRTNTVVRRKELGDVAGINPIKNYFVGNYEQLTLKGNIASSIVKAEIRNGYLWITFHDGTDVNTGYVLGDPGYSPQINLNENNDNEHYRLDITYQSLDSIIKNFTTPNLIGPKGDKVELKIENNNVVWKYEKETEWIKLVSVDDISGKDGKDGDEVILRTSDNYIQWKYTSEAENSWKDLISIESLKVKGDKGENGDNIELRVFNNTIQWKLLSDENWNDLITINEISGKNGKSISINSININTIESNKTPSAIRTVVEETDVYIAYDFTFNIPKAEKGDRGDKGYSPKINAVKDEEKGITTITITNLKDDEEVNSIVQILDGKNAGKGDPGYSPQITTDKVGKVNTITITSLDNTTQAEITKTIQILDGNGIKNVSINSENELIITLDDGTIKNLGNIKGTDGINGQDGADGFSPIITTQEIENGYRIKITTAENTKTFDILNGTNGIDGYTPTITSTKTEEGYDVVITNKHGSDLIEIKNGINGIDGANGSDGYSPTVNLENVKDGVKITVINKDGTIEKTVKNGINGEKGEKGDNGTDGKSFLLGNVNTEIVRNGFANVEITKDPNIEDTYNFNFEIPSGEAGNNGKDMEVGTVTTNSIESENEAEVVIKLNNTLSNASTNIYDFEFNIPKGIQGIPGENGTNGSNGVDGNDGYSPTITVDPNNTEEVYKLNITYKDENNEVRTLTTDNLKGKDGLKGTDGINGTNGINGKNVEVGIVNTTSEGEEVSVNISLNDTSSDDTKNVYDFQFNIPKPKDGSNGVDGNDGYSPTITEDPNNTETIYKLNITYKDENNEVKNLTTVNLKGNDGLKGDDGYSPTVIENANNTETIYKLDITYKDSEGTIQTYTTPNLKGDNGTASKFIICETLPAIAEGELNTIYFLLTPIYQRGLNIGLTDDTNANKNFYEEWVIIEKEDGSRSWEILSPQVYRISEKMIDYVWKVRNDYTVYDDWFDTTDISDYQKEYGDITPLSNFVYRIEGSEIILVKYIGSGDVYLNIAPRYKIGDKVYTVTELDGTYYPEKTYYQIDGDGNVTNYTFNTDLFQYDDNGIETTQTLLTGPQVYSLYIADTVTKLTRVLINTSNIPKYHIPSGIETIGDYAFYSSANQTMVFEKLSADGKTAVQVGFESSNVKYIGEYGCACTTNMRMINDEGIDTNYLTTPAGLKKISNHAFYRAGQIAHVDTRKSSNLYVGKEAFTRANLSAVQYLSPTTYYTDNSFLGYTELYHDSRVVNGGGLYFYNNETIGYNYNDIEHTEASETAKLNVTLTTVDPVFE